VGVGMEGGTGARAPLAFSNCWTEQARPGQFTTGVIFTIIHI